MSGLSAFLQDLWVNTFSIVADKHPKEVMIVSNLSLNVMCTRVLKGISQQFTGNSVHFVLKSRRQSSPLALDDNAKDRRVAVCIRSGSLVLYRFASAILRDRLK